MHYISVHIIIYIIHACIHGSTLLKKCTTFLFKKDGEYHEMSDPEKSHMMRECHIIHNLCSVAGDFEGFPEESYDIELS